jgi:ribosomal protein S18 acetylase RimI-like enzyme
MNYFVINKDYMGKYVDEFVSIIKNVPNEYWSKEHFLRDLNGKWDYSIGMRNSGILVAFIIASIKDDNIHIHKFMVKEGFRSMGFGKLILDTFIEIVSQSFNSITLKVYKENSRAIDFYKSNAFFILSDNNELIYMKRSLY